MKYAELEWNNGTPRSAGFDDVYFSAEGGLAETRHVFLQQNRLPQRWQQQDSFVIAETGFGTGLNFLVTLQTWLQSAPAGARLHYISIENRPVSPRDIARLAGRWPELGPCVDALLGIYPPPVPGMHLLEFAAGAVRLHLVFDDIEAALARLSHQVDAWYLDGFAPSRNPGMWSPRVFELVGRNTRPGGSFATYTAAGTVRRGLANAGFVVQKSAGFGAKREMLKGSIGEQRCHTVDKPWFEVPAHRHRQKHAAIIGAGLAGLTAAYALCRRGWRITLIDRHAGIAEEASGNPAGLLMPRLSLDRTLDARFYANAFIYAVQCLDRLQAAAQERFWFKTGNLLLDTDGRLKRVCASHEYPDSFIRMIDSRDTQTVAGIGLEQDALLFVDAGWVDVRRLCAALLQACSSSIEYRQAAIADLEYAGGRWHATVAGGGPAVTADCAVVANGHRARRFSALEWLPIRAARGQLTRVVQTQRSRMIACGISAKRYIAPAIDGSHIIGASYQLDDTSTDLSAEDQAENIRRIEEIVGAGIDPDSPLAGRVAFRAVSEDRSAIVGPVPDRGMFEREYRGVHHGRASRLYPPGEYLPGLYVSTAHGSRGLCSCFISGEMIASMVAAEPLPVEKDVADYLNPARFIIRKLKRDRR